MLEGGFILLHRSILRWEWYGDLNTARLFIHLLLTVNYEPQRWQGIAVERGQRVASMAKLADETGLTVKQVRTALEHLKRTGEVTHKATSKYGLFTVNHYDRYQPRGEPEGTLEEIKESAKYILNILPHPIVIIDEAGALSYSSLLLLHEFWNGTQDCCGWYLMGADGLRTKLQKGKGTSKKQSYKELFSRFSSKYNHIVPDAPDDREAFFRNLIESVLAVNIKDKRKINKIVNMGLATDSQEAETGLRRAETLLILNED